MKTLRKQRRGLVLPWSRRPRPRTALAKTSADFLSGDVLVGLSRMLSNFSVDLSSGFMHLGPLAVPVWLLAVGTVAAEYALAVGFWVRRLRWPTAILGLLFHALATQVVTIAYLHVVSVFLYTSFLLPFDRAPAPSRPTRTSVRAEDEQGHAGAPAGHAVIGSAG